MVEILVKGWLTYIGAYACAVLVWYACLLAVFTVSGGGYGLDKGGMVIFVWFLPLVIALTAFAFAYRAMSGRRYDSTSWMIGGGVIFGIFLIMVAPVYVAGVSPLFGMIGSLGGSFIVGRFLTEWGAAVSPKMKESA